MGYCARAAQQSPSRGARPCDRGRGRAAGQRCGCSPTTSGCRRRRCRWSSTARPARAAIPKPTQDRIRAAARAASLPAELDRQSLRRQRTLHGRRDGAGDQRGLLGAGDERHRGSAAAGRLPLLRGQPSPPRRPDRRVSAADARPRRRRSDRRRHAVRAAAAGAGRRGLGPRHDAGRHQHRARPRARGAGSRSTTCAALGHTRIAFIKGQAFSSDTAVRWRAIRDAARSARRADRSAR